jgi:hypothetical protein
MIKKFWSKLKRLYRRLAKPRREGLIWLFTLIFSGTFSIVLSLLTIKFAFGNSKTIRLTNICFAIFAALASICFSWNKSEYVEPLDRKGILQAGELSLLGAVLFLIASALKYASISTLANSSEVLYKFFNIFFIVLLFFLYMISFFVGTLSVMKILATIASRLLDDIDDHLPQPEQEVDETPDNNN